MRVLFLMLCIYDEPAVLTSLMKQPAFRAYAEAAHGATFTDGMRVLAWDHQYDRSATYIWRKDQLALTQDPIKAGEPLVVFVTRSNPYLFRATATPITRTDSDDLEMLKRYAALAGSALRVQKSLHPADTPPTDPDNLAKVLSDISQMHMAALHYAQLVELGQPFEADPPDAEKLMTAAQRLSTAARKVRAHSEELKAVPAAMKTAAWLHSFGKVVEAYRDAPCQGIDAPVPVHAGRFVAETGKKLTGGFKVVGTVDPDVIHYNRPAPFERNVTVNATSRWGLGAGLAYTPESENSEVALFANFHPAAWTLGRRIRAGWQLGFGTSTDDPAVYTGPSLDLGPMMRVGAGYAIKPDNSGLYLSLSLSLDGIPLFQ